MSKLSLYVIGFKYCTDCGAWKKTDSARCPYCNQKLRTKGRDRLR